MSTTETTLEYSNPQDVKLTKLQIRPNSHNVEFGLKFDQHNIECVCDTREEWEANERLRVVTWLLTLIILYVVLRSLDVPDLFALGLSLVLTAGILITDRESQLLTLAAVTGIIGILFVIADILH